MIYDIIYFQRITLAKAVTERDRKLLKETNLWELFCEDRYALRSTGMNAREASEECLEKYLPRAEIIKYQFNNNATPAANGVSDGEEAEEEGLPKSSSSSSHNKPIKKGEPIEIPDEVMSRVADVVEVIEWVAKNIERPFCHDVINTAPCAEAVGLLRYYSSSMRNKGEFWKDQYAKLIPSRSQLNHRGKVEFDGKDILNAINNIKDGILDFELEGSLGE